MILEQCAEPKVYAREKVEMEEGMGQSPCTLKEAHKIWENKILNTCCIMSSISRLFNGLLKLQNA